jgi:type IV pilus assembly protein PilX
MRAAIHRRAPGRRAGQRGISLITTLIFMIAALALGLSVMGVTVMQERIIGNTKDQDLAFQAAEATLRDAEADVNTNVTASTVFTDICTSGLCTVPSLRATPNANPVDQQSGFSWSTAGQVRAYGQYTGAPALPTGMLSSTPVYVIEKIGAMGTPSGESMVLGAAPSSTGTGYRITVRAVGARAETVVYLQSIYATP